MANRQVITIPLDLPRDEACAFAELLKRTSYEDCLRRSNRLKRYTDGREEADVSGPLSGWSKTDSPKPASPRADFCRRASPIRGARLLPISAILARKILAENTK